MNILVTGKNGFLATELHDLFRPLPYDVTFMGREDLNLLDEAEVDSFFKDRHFDALIHTAILGGTRNREDDSSDFYHNTLMFLNLLKHISSFDKFINFDSGASFGRCKDITKYSDGDLMKSIPTDFYGMSKLVGSLLGKAFPNFINLRIFACFGPKETEDRFIKRSIRRYLENKSIEVFEEKYVDFFYVKDLFKTLIYVIHNDVENRDINLCYDKKYKLSEVASIINQLGEHEVPIVTGDSAYNYTGSPKALSALGLPLEGLKSGIEDVYNSTIQGNLLSIN
tara:strand:- start:74192 stop:75037 length:846 start_codon:yes stop_codon:yes gene_type:complete